MTTILYEPKPSKYSITNKGYELVKNIRKIELMFVINC